MRIDLHINQSLAPVSEVIDCAARADASSYSAVWVLDHFATMRPAAEGEMLDPHVLLGAIAAKTHRVRLGVLVNNCAARPAEVIAGATATLNQVSSGRAALGLGAGAAPGSFFAREHEALGNRIEASMQARHDNTMRALGLIRDLWSGRRDTGVRFPKPKGRVPVVVGVNSVELARRAAAEHCGINVRSDHPRLAEILAHADSSLEDWSASVWLPYSADLRNPAHPQLRRLAEMGVTRVMLLTMSRDDVLNA